MVTVTSKKSNIVGSLENKTQYIAKRINGRSFLEIKHPVINAARTGSALKTDPYHAFNNIIDNFVRDASKFSLKGGDGIIRELYQLEESIDGVSGIFEWIVDPRPGRGMVHRRFIKDGSITGLPNMISPK